MVAKDRRGVGGRRGGVLTAVCGRRSRSAATGWRCLGLEFGFELWGSPMSPALEGWPGAAASSTAEANCQAVRQGGDGAAGRMVKDNRWAGSAAGARDVGVRKGRIETAGVGGRRLGGRCGRHQPSGWQWGGGGRERSSGRRCGGREEMRWEEEMCVRIPTDARTLIMCYPKTLAKHQNTRIRGLQEGTRDAA